MQERDKHNIYSKEELLKILKEGKGAPADMDAFEQEALEGLRLLYNPGILDTLDKQVDEIIDQEKNKKRTIFYLSAAASLLLIVGLFFFFKGFLGEKENTVLAEKKETPLPQEYKPAFDQNAKEKTSNQTQIASEPRVPEKPILLAEETKKAKQNRKSDDISKPVASKPSAKLVAQNRIVATTPKEEKKSIAVADEETAIVDMDIKSGGTIDKEQFQRIASKDVNSIAATQPGAVRADEDAKVAQAPAAFSNANEATPATSFGNNKATKKSKADLFYSNSADKNDNAKMYKEPTFIGGDSTFAKYIKQNLKVSSPANSGTIVLKFTVNKKGITKDIEVIKPLNNCKACSEDVINLIKSIKKWQPALINDDTIEAPKKISIQYN
jgi:hypothetical protein